MQVNTKACGVCHTVLPATREFFHKSDENLYGLAWACKACASAKAREWREQRKARAITYDPSTVKVCGKCGKEYPATPEFFGVQASRADGLKAACRQCSAAYRRAYHEANRDRARALSHKWFTENRERVRQKERDRGAIRKVERKAWADANPEAVRRHRVKSQHIRRARTRAGGSFTLAELARVTASQGGRCWWCGEPMSKPTVDHLIPLARGGQNVASNIVLACRSCNSRKGAKLPHEWNGRLL